MDVKENIVFASCNRQDKPQGFWKTLQSVNPKLFLWVGDVIYPKSRRLESLKKAFQQLLSNSLYSDFVKGRQIDGVWDDHDYGVNDAGKHVVDRIDRQHEYLHFIQESGATDLSYLHSQDGIYHARDIILNDVAIKIIFLDTRSFRDSHFIRSLGEFEFLPLKGLTALIAAALRASYSVMGFGREYSGAVLGPVQWKWLENTLTHSEADMHIVVSSIQLMTTNPVVESWGHFPVEKTKLFDLMAKVDPKNLIFLSGDVHMGEIAAVPYQRENGREGSWLEFTSSGLTHSCAQGSIHQVLGPLMTWMFAKHRRTGKDSFLLKKNFGVISVQQEKYQSVANISIISLDSSPDHQTDRLDYLLRLERKDETPSKIANYQADDFPVLGFQYRLLIYLLIGVVLYCCPILFRRIIKRKKAPSKKVD
jgi:alkaline phosphatase D